MRGLVNPEVICSIVSISHIQMESVGAEKWKCKFRKKRIHVKFLTQKEELALVLAKWSVAAVPEFRFSWIHFKDDKNVISNVTHYSK